MTVLNTFLGSVVVQIIDPIIMLLAAGAFVVFLWGVFKFISKAGDETAREEGRQSILYGLIGLVIIFGVFGILSILTNTFGLAPVSPISH
jgi:uncharacterized membrane protein YfcA